VLNYSQWVVYNCKANWSRINMYSCWTRNRNSVG